MFMERLIVVLTSGQLISKRNCYVSRSENRYLFTGTRIRRWRG